jgi:hypothetical protein
MMNVMVLEKVYARHDERLGKEGVAIGGALRSFW